MANTNIKFVMEKLKATSTTGDNRPDFSAFVDFNNQGEISKKFKNNEKAVGPYTFSTEVDARDLKIGSFPGLPYTIPITFRAIDRDWPTVDDIVDVNPTPNQYNLELFWDLSSRKLVGDIRGNFSSGSDDKRNKVRSGEVTFHVESDPFEYDSFNITAPQRIIRPSNAIEVSYVLENEADNTFAITSWDIPSIYQTEISPELLPEDSTLQITPFIISEELTNAYGVNVVLSLRTVRSSVEFDDFFNTKKEVRVDIPSFLSSSSSQGLAKSSASALSEPILLDRVNLNFETDAFGDSLDAGETITDQYSELGLSIISARYSHPNVINGNSRGNPMIFDSENPTGGDFDLETTNQGNVLIVSQDNNSSNPNDSSTGGVFRFDWDQPVNIDQIGLLDIDADESVRVITVDSDNNRINEHHIKEGEGAGNNQLQDLIIGDEGVYGMVVQLSRSGAITNVLYTPSIDDGTSSLNSVETDVNHDILIGSMQNDTMSNLDVNTELSATGNDESLLIPELNSTLATMDQGSIIPLETDLVDNVMMTDSISVPIPEDEPMIYVPDIPGGDPETVI